MESERVAPFTNESCVQDKK